MVRQSLAREVFEKEAGKLAPERDCEPGRLEVNIPKVILEGGAQKAGTEGGSQDQKGQPSSPTLDPEGGAGDLEDYR